MLTDYQYGYMYDVLVIISLILLQIGTVNNAFFLVTIERARGEETEEVTGTAAGENGQLL